MKSRIQVLTLISVATLLAAPVLSDIADDDLAALLGEVADAAAPAEEKVEAAAEAAAAEVAEVAEEAAAEVVEVAEVVAEAAEEAAPAAEAEAAVEEVAAAAEEAKEDALDALLAPAAAEEEAAEVAEAAPAAEKVEEVAEVAEVVAEAAEEAAPAAEAEAAVEEVAAAAKEDALDALLAPADIVEEAAEVVAEAEAAPAAEEVEAVAEEVAEVAEEAPAVEPLEVADFEDEEVAEEVAEAAEVEEVAEEVAAVEEVVEEVAPVEKADSGFDAIVSDLYTLEKIRREALDEHGRSSLAAARQALRNGNYPEAQRLYEEAKKFLVNRRENQDMILEAEKGVAEAIYRQALVLQKKDDLQGAVQLARQAREKNHPKAAKLVAELQDIIDHPPEEPPPKTAKRWKEKNYQKDRETIARRLSRAREYYLTSEYDKARQEVEFVLREDPYNQDAVILRRRIGDRQYDLSTDEFSATRSLMMDEVRAAWTPRGRYAVEVVNENDVAASATAGTAVGPSGKTTEELTEDKMRSITIPEINFKAANINDVVAFFESASREFDDPAVPPEQRGVSFVLKLGQEAAAQNELASDDPFAPVAPATGVPPVNFNAHYINLWDALKVITEVAGLKFRIRGNIVMIMPLNAPEGNMVPRSYTVLPSIEERAANVSSELSTSMGLSGPGAAATGFDGFGGGDTDNAGSGVNWKQLFTDMGVKWPDGSSISYIRSINKMRVYNTPENLVDFETALQDLNVTPRQVEIEARFVEVSQTDLESLGFQWLLTDDYEFAQKRGDSQQYLKVTKGSGTTGLRYLPETIMDSGSLNNLITTEAFKDSVSDKLLGISSVLTNPELSFVLHALSQQSNTDLLSAPKVVTRDAAEATIKVVTEYIYPTEYEVKETDTSSGSSDNDNLQMTIPMVEPQEFQMREVGVILQVRPQVNDDGQMIDLELNPQIVTEPDWEDYGYEYPFVTEGEVKTIPVKMRQPLFHVRSISTQLSIYNGATVVMGGMILEERMEMKDKVPILGDIPLIGRFFRSTYEKSDKRNLLIFVTARLVDPAGRTLKTTSEVSDTAAFGD